MASISAKQVANDVIESIGKHRKPILRKIAVKRGYSIHTADNPKLITETKSYQDVIQPILTRWNKERERITKELESKDLTKVEYQDLMRSMDLLTKQIQLASGGATENIAIGVKRLKDNELLELINKENPANE